MIRSGSSGWDSGRGSGSASISAAFPRSARVGRPSGQRGTSRPRLITRVSSSRSSTATAVRARPQPAGLSIQRYARSGATGWVAITVA